MYSAEYKGILFVEGMPENCTVIRDISTEINEFFGQSQLKSLDDVKDRMVYVVAKCGGNAVVDFKYGQRSSFWKSLFGLDDVMWYASGKIAIIK
jgi:hypothetical protein